MKKNPEMFSNVIDETTELLFTKGLDKPRKWGWAQKRRYGIGVHGEIKKFVVTLWVMRHFYIVRGAPRACVDFCDPTAVS